MPIIPTLNERAETNAVNWPVIPATEIVEDGVELVIEAETDKPHSDLAARSSLAVEKILYSTEAYWDITCKTWGGKIADLQKDHLDPFRITTTDTKSGNHYGLVPVCADLEKLSELTEIRAAILDAIERREQGNIPPKSRELRLRHALGGQAIYAAIPAASAGTFLAASGELANLPPALSVMICAVASTVGMATNLAKDIRKEKGVDLSSICYSIIKEAKTTPTANTLPDYNKLPKSNWARLKSAFIDTGVEDTFDMKTELQVRQSIRNHLFKIKNTREYDDDLEVRFTLASMFAEHAATARECDEIIADINTLISTLDHYDRRGKQVIRQLIAAQYGHLREIASAYEDLDMQLSAFQDQIKTPGRIDKIYEVLGTLANGSGDENKNTNTESLRAITLSYLNTYLAAIDISGGFVNESTVVDVQTAHEIYTKAAGNVPFDELLPEAERLLCIRLASALRVDPEKVHVLSADDYKNLDDNFKAYLRYVQDLPELQEKIRALAARVGIVDGELRGPTNPLDVA